MNVTLNFSPGNRFFDHSFDVFSFGIQNPVGVCVWGGGGGG
eukprot:SAG11_NODE_15484_length_576_cov_1.578616_1_plen_40_part_10